MTWSPFGWLQVQELSEVCCLSSFDCFSFLIQQLIILYRYLHGSPASMDFSAKGTYLNLDRADVFDHYLFKAHT